MPGPAPRALGAHGEIWTRRDEKTGAWRALVKVRDHDGVTRQVMASATTQAAAKRALLNKLAERRPVLDADAPMSGRTTLRRARELWLAEERLRTKHPDEADADRAEIRWTTYEWYRRESERLVRPGGIGDLTVVEAHAGRLQAYIDGHSTYSAKRNQKKVLRLIFATVVRSGVLTSNPVDSLRQLINPDDLRRAFTPEERMQVARAAREWMDSGRKGNSGPKHSRDYPDVLMLLDGTGARLGEALAVRWCDIQGLDGERPLLWLSGTIKYAQGKGVYRQTSTSTHTGTKTLAGYRSVYLPQSVAAMLRRRRSVWCPNEHDAVFATRTGNWHQVSKFAKKLREVFDLAGLPWATSHSFRRTVATILDREADDHGRAATRQLGHATEGFTQATYVERDRIAPDNAALLDGYLAAAWGIPGENDLSLPA